MADTKPSPVQFAEEYKTSVDEGRPNLYQAMIAAGYSENVAKRGKAALTGTMIDALVSQGIDYARIGEKLEPKMVENFIAGKLMTNALLGQSEGNEALKMLGSMVKFASFKSDQNTNLIVLSNDQPAHLIAPEQIIEASQPQQLKTSDVD